MGFLEEREKVAGKVPGTQKRKRKLTVSWLGTVQCSRPFVGLFTCSKITIFCFFKKSFF